MKRRIWIRFLQKVKKSWKIFVVFLGWVTFMTYHGLTTFSRDELVSFIAVGLVQAGLLGYLLYQLYDIAKYEIAKEDRETINTLKGYY